MKKFIKFTCILLCFIMSALLFAACAKPEVNDKTPPDDNLPPTPPEMFIYEINDNKATLIDITDKTETSITIPSRIENVAVTKISKTAFKGLESVEDIVIPNSITEIENYALEDCQNIVSISTPICFTYFYKLFHYDSPYKVPASLTELKITSDVNIVIPAGAFQSLRVKSIQLSNLTTKIENGAFSNCTELESIDLSQTNIVEIGTQAFYNCSNLVSISMPNTVTTIGKGSFRECSTLESVKLSENLSEIPQEAFSNCTQLSSITWGKNSNVHTIGSDAFYKIGITTLILPRSVQTLNTGAFNLPKCTTVYLHSNIKKLGGVSYSIYVKIGTKGYCEPPQKPSSGWSTMINGIRPSDIVWGATMPECT